MHSDPPLARPVPLELELKLTCPPEAVEALRKAPLVALHARSRGTTRKLETVYYDTLDHALHARGATLRVRRAGGKFTQTLKSGPDAGDALMARGEWEAALPSMAPDLSRLAGEECPLDLSGIDSAALRPVFAARTSRHLQVIDLPEAEIELAFDRGEIETERGALPIGEVELELKAGDAAGLYHLALHLLEQAPLRVGISGKAERGYALLLGERPRAFKAKPPPLDADMSLDRAMELILTSCRRHVLANEAAAEVGLDEDGVHQMRVALRRLRSGLGLFRKVVPSPALDAFRDDAKWLASALGAVRDWDVFLDKTLAEPARALDEDFEALAGLARQQRTAAHAGLVAALEDPRCTRLHLGLEAWIRRRGWRDAATADALAALDGPATRFAEETLAALDRKLRKRGRHFKRLDTAQRHRLRLDAKKLRYAADFLAPLYPAAKPARRYLAALAEIQETLGYLNDGNVAASLLRDKALASDDPRIQRLCGAVLGWHARGASGHEKAFAEAFRAFRKAKRFWHAA